MAERKPLDVGSVQQCLPKGGQPVQFRPSYFWVKVVVVSAVGENTVRPKLTTQQIAAMNVEQCLNRQLDLRVFVDLEKSMSVQDGQDEFEAINQRIKKLQRFAGLRRFMRRFWGQAYSDCVPTGHKPASAHIEAEWTTPDHWGHNGGARADLPQIVVKASGWKARLIALFLWPKEPCRRWD